MIVVVERPLNVNWVNEFYNCKSLFFEFEVISKIITLPCPKNVGTLVVNFES